MKKKEKDVNEKFLKDTLNDRLSDLIAEKKKQGISQRRLIEIAKDENTSLDMQVKINLDLLPYIYPKRKSIDMNSNEMPEVKIYINREEAGVESKEYF